MTKHFTLISLLIIILSISSCGLLGDGDGPGKINAEILDCRIENDIVLTDRNTDGVDYIVECDIEVWARLTIEEGTIIEFKEGAGLSVEFSGSIRAEGIGGLPVIFRGQDAGDASWKGIYIFTETTSSIFDYVEIQDAGAGQSFSVFEDETAAITLDGRMRFTNSKIINSGGHGIWDTSELHNSVISEFENNTIEECKEYPLFIKTDYLSDMDLSSSKFRENGDNNVAFTKKGSDISTSTRLETLDIPYLFTHDVHLSASLNVEAGVDILMAEGVEIATGQTSGAITMAGTATNRISIRGEESQAGYWKGILFTGDSNNILENVDISDGGSSPAGNNGELSNIVLEFSSQLTMIDCTSSRSNSSCDVVLHSFGGTPTFTDLSTDLKICEE